MPYLMKMRIPAVIEPVTAGIISYQSDYDYAFGFWMILIISEIM